MNHSPEFASGAAFCAFDMHVVPEANGWRVAGPFGGKEASGKVLSVRGQLPDTQVDTPDSLGYPSRSALFLSSSTAEHPAVNRRVVGSNPT